MNYIFKRWFNFAIVVFALTSKRRIATSSIRKATCWKYWLTMLKKTIKNHNNLPLTFWKNLQLTKILTILDLAAHFQHKKRLKTIFIFFSTFRVNFFNRLLTTTVRIICKDSSWRVKFFSEDRYSPFIISRF